MDGTTTHTSNAISGTPLSGTRVVTIDGLRGIAMVLVVLSHGWALWPTTAIQRHAVAGNVFRSGDLAVSIFLVVAGYLLVVGELSPTRSAPPRAVDLARAAARRVIRIAAPLYLVVVAMLILATVDPDPRYSDHTTRESAGHLLTFTWNWYLENNPLAARPDMGHLWYVSVFVQGMLILLGLTAVLGRSRLSLAATLIGLLVLVVWWRHHVIVTEGSFRALLRTSTRTDGLLWGALLGLAAPLLAHLRRSAVIVACVGAVGLSAMVLVVGNAESYFYWPGQLICVSAVALVAGLVLLPAESRWNAVLGTPVLAWLGRTSLPLYIWHYPIFWTVARHTSSWNWGARTAVALALTLGVTVLLDLVVDRPLVRWYARHASPGPPGQP